MKKKKRNKKIFAKFPFHCLTSHVVWNKNRAYASWWWMNLRCCSLSHRIQSHRITEYPELDGTHRDHWNPTPGPAFTAEREPDAGPDLGTGHMTSPSPARYQQQNLLTTGQTAKLIHILTIKYSLSILWLWWITQVAFHLHCCGNSNRIEIHPKQNPVCRNTKLS